MYTLCNASENHTHGREYVAVTDAKQMRNPCRTKDGMGWRTAGTTCRPIAFALDLAPPAARCSGVNGETDRLIVSGAFSDAMNGMRGEANR